jgi:hypothetical protein
MNAKRNLARSSRPYEFPLIASLRTLLQPKAAHKARTALLQAFSAGALFHADALQAEHAKAQKRMK